MERLLMRTNRFTPTGEIIMNLDLAFLDWAIIISLLIFTYQGFRHNFVQQLLGLLGSVAAVVCRVLFL